MISRFLSLIVAIPVLGAPALAADVRVWQDVLTLPTYLEGAPNPNPPRFFWPIQ